MGCVFFGGGRGKDCARVTCTRRERKGTNIERTKKNTTTLRPRYASRGGRGGAVYGGVEEERWRRNGCETNRIVGSVHFYWWHVFLSIPLLLFSNRRQCDVSDPSSFQALWLESSIFYQPVCVISWDFDWRVLISAGVCHLLRAHQVPIVSKVSNHIFFLLFAALACHGIHTFCITN